MKVLLLNHTENCEELIAKAAKLCYSASSIDDLLERIENESQEAFIKKLMGMGHDSPLEHVSFNFGVEGVSRVLTHQLVRHRIASYSQQSQRYVTLDKTFDYIEPDSIKASQQAHEEYLRLMEVIHKIYKAFLEIGIPPEDARYVLPNATETKIFITMNARTLLHFFSKRCCNRAQWEIRKMAIKMLMAVKRVAPLLFEGSGPACVKGDCGEGKMSCDSGEIVRGFFEKL